MATTTKAGGFSTEERAAMKGAAAEKRTAASRRAEDKAAAEAQDLADAIAKLPADEQELAKRIDELVMDAVPELARKTWYGFPAWAKDGKVLVFFKYGSKFKDRYSTLGFNDTAQLDDGDMWAKEFAILKIGDAEAKRITDLARRAAG